MKELVIIFAAFGLVFAGSMHDYAMSSEVDILINKLVEKGVFKPSDAKQLVMEMQKESAREEDAIKRVAAETATRMQSRKRPRPSNPRFPNGCRTRPSRATSVSFLFYGCPAPG
jgi:hypothetical protein